MTIVEVPDRRETFGHDAQAINKHSIRVYAVPSGREYTLDRTLDGCPPFFTLTVTTYWRPMLNRSDRSLNLARIVPVQGLDYWGDGWSWPHAETVALATINAEEANS